MSNKNNQLRETLSALMDHEAEELEFRRVLKASEQDSEVLETWHRYQLAASAMRRELPARMTDLSGRISEALADEAPHSKVFRLLQPLGRVAVAASVAVLAVVAVQQGQKSGLFTDQPELATQSRPAAVDDSGPRFQSPAGYELPAINARTVSTATQPDRHAEYRPRPVLMVKRLVRDAATQQELQTYLNDAMSVHTENAARSTSHGVLPYARLPHQEPDMR